MKMPRGRPGATQVFVKMFYRSPICSGLAGPDANNARSLISPKARMFESVQCVWSPKACPWRVYEILGRLSRRVTCLARWLTKYLNRSCPISPL